MQIFWCDTQIGGFPPINTDKTHRNLEKKSVIKSADFLGQEKSADFFVCEEIVWWDTSLSLLSFFFNDHKLMSMGGEICVSWEICHLVY